MRCSTTNARVCALLDGESQVIHFDHEPYAVLTPLVQGRLPEDAPAGDFDVEVQPNAGAVPAARGHILTST